MSNENTFVCVHVPWFYQEAWTDLDENVALAKHCLLNLNSWVNLAKYYQQSTPTLLSCFALQFYWPEFLFVFMVIQFKYWSIRISFNPNVCSMHSNKASRQLWTTSPLYNTSGEFQAWCGGSCLMEYVPWEDLLPWKKASFCSCNSSENHSPQQKLTLNM